MIGISFFGIREAALMFALGFGYIICYLAKKEDKGMQSLGHFIGMSIIILSTLLILVNIYARFNLKACAKIIGSSIQCPVTGMMGKAATPAPVKK